MKHYHGIQLCLCIATTALLFYFTLPWVLGNGESYRRTDRLSVMAKKAGISKPSIVTEKDKLTYAAAPPVVKVEKEWDDHLATIAHALEAFSPLSTLGMSVYLWRRKRTEMQPGKEKP